MSVLDWLLQSDPAVRWQVLRDLADAPADVVTAERGRVATEGWGARLLAARDEDGQWAGGACFPASGWDRSVPGQPWTSTLHTLELLCRFGLDPASAQAVETVALVRENCRWEHAGQRFFDGEVEACINGRTLAIGAYFGEDVGGIVERLLGEQLDDGGWNCETENGSVRSSFHSTICVLEGLLAYEHQTGGSPELAAARLRGEDYLLERALFRRLSTGEVVDHSWLEFSFPPRWYYDVLRGLDHFRAAGDASDERLREAIELVRSKQQADGTWLLENTHPGAVHFRLEDGDGRPSRWNTLRALRVLRWAGLPGLRTGPAAPSRGSGQLAAAPGDDRTGSHRRPQELPRMTQDTTTSTATVATDRPGRYGKQLVSHLTRRAVGEWDDDAGTGFVEFAGGRVTLTSADGALALALAAGADDVARLEDVVGRHLVRFGNRDELVVRWTRSDGTPGSVQENTAEE